VLFPLLLRTHRLVHAVSHDHAAAPCVQELAVAREAIGDLALVQQPSTGKWRPVELLHPLGMPLQRAVSLPVGHRSGEAVVLPLDTGDQAAVNSIPVDHEPVMYALDPAQGCTAHVHLAVICAHPGISCP
jgi:hypothetical protein